MTKRLLIAIHDVWPGSQQACQRMMEGLSQRGWNRIALMVIPDYLQRNSLALPENRTFVNWLRSCATDGHEIWAHGLTHACLNFQTPMSRVGLRYWVNRFLTNNESEFLGLSVLEKQARLRQSLKLFSDQDIPVVGFTPPTWWGGLSARAWEQDFQDAFRFQDLRFSIQDFKQGFHRWCPALVWPARSHPSRVLGGALYLRVLNAFPVIRFALHPNDSIHSDFWPTLERVGSHRTLIQSHDLFPMTRGEQDSVPPRGFKSDSNGSLVSSFDRWPTQPL